MSYEYKCVGAPERVKRLRGARTRSDRVAGAMQELINDEAVDGWEYLRTDLVPVEEKAGLFSRSSEVHRAILIFRRPTVQFVPGHATAVPMAQAPVQMAQPAAPAPAPVHAPPPEQPFRLSTEDDGRGPPRPSPRGAAHRAPKGLG